MNRRFRVPGMQQPRLPHQRTQRLPDDLNDFIATGRVLSQRQPPVAAPVSIPSDSPADPMLLSSIAPAPPESPASAAPHPAINPVASSQGRPAVPALRQESPALPAPGNTPAHPPSRPDVSSSRSMFDSISKLVDAAEARPKERFSLADMPFLDRDFESLSEFSSERRDCAASLKVRSLRRAGGGFV